MTKTSRTETATDLAAALLLMLFALGAWLGLPQLWGINLGKFLPPEVSVAVLIGALLLFRRRWSSAVLARLDTLSDRMAQQRSVRVAVIMILALGLAVLFSRFYSVTTLLGDATLRLNQIKDGRLLLWTEVGDYLLHAVLYRTVFQPLGIIVERCYNMTSAVGGFFFVIGAWRLASYLWAKQAVIVWLVMLTSGLTVLFFGYIESYSLLAALLPYMILSGLKVLDGRSSRTSFLIFYLAAGLIHSVSLWLFLGVLLVTWNLPPDSDEQARKQLHRRLLLLFLILLAAAYLGRGLGWFGLERYLLAPWGREGYGLGLFTLLHGLDVLNWLLLSALPFLLLLPALPARAEDLSDGDRQRSLLAVWMILPSLLFMLFFTPQLGGPRDWDLFSLPAFLLIPASLILYYTRKRALPSRMIPILVVAAFTTGSFAVINSSPAKAVDRFAEVIEESKFKNNALEYLSLMGHAREFPELTDRRLEFALKAWDEPVYKRTDTIRVLNYLDWITHYRDSRGHAPINVPMLLWADSTTLHRQLLLANYYLQFGNVAELTACAPRLERLFPDQAQAYHHNALIYLKLGRLPLSGASFERAYELDGNDVGILVGFAAYLYEAEEYQRASTLLERAVNLNPSSFLANHNLALVYIELKRLDSVAEYLARAKELISSESHARMVRRTLGLLELRLQGQAGP